MWHATALEAVNDRFDRVAMRPPVDDDDDDDADDDNDGYYDDDNDDDADDADDGYDDRVAMRPPAESIIGSRPFSLSHHRAFYPPFAFISFQSHFAPKVHILCTHLNVEL